MRYCIGHALSTPGAGVCLPEGTGAQDGLCGQEEGQPFDPAKECATGTACITFAEDAVKGLCLPEVTDCSAPSACAAGRVCLPLSSGAGVCGEDCQADATVCTANAKNCSEIGTGDSICTPAGSVAFGGLCSSANLCAPDLTCLRVSAASAEGYCTQTCISDPDCPTTPAGAACAEVAPPTSLCVFPCGQPGQTCPTGLTCDTVGTSSLCVAQ